MNVIAFALALVQRHATESNLPAGLAGGIAKQFEADVAATTDHVKALLERRAGFKNGLVGKCDANRLRDPRLRTTAPNERSLALVKRETEWRDELAELLPRVLAVSLKLEFAELETIEERRRELELRDAQHAREVLGIYVEAIRTVDILFNDYNVTRRDHATISDVDYRDIAAIILRKPAHTIPVVEHNRRPIVEEDNG